MRKVLIVATGFIAISVGAFVLFFHFDPMCGEERVSEVASPDGRYVAVSMIRNCGATTGYVGHLNLRLASAALHRDFFGGTINDGMVFIHDGDSPINFCWLGPRRINLRYPESERAFQPQTAWRDVEITYGRDCL